MRYPINRLGGNFGVKPNPVSFSLRKNKKSFDLPKVFVCVAVVVILFGVFMGVNLVQETKEDKQINELGGNVDRSLLEKVKGVFENSPDIAVIINENKPDAGENDFLYRFNLNPTEDYDGDGVLNINDIDVDGDGILNSEDTELTPPLDTDCIDGQARACGLPGVCSGFQICMNGTWAEECEGESESSEEVCADGLDNDCDGVVDNGCDPCFEGSGATKDCKIDGKNGTKTCNQGYWSECVEWGSAFQAESNEGEFFYNEIVGQYVEEVCCGDGICTFYETCASCEEDCGVCDQVDKLILDMEFEGDLKDSTENFYADFKPNKKCIRTSRQEYDCEDYLEPKFVAKGNEKAWDGFSYFTFKCNDVNSEICKKDLTKFSIEFDLRVGRDADGDRIIFEMTPTKDEEFSLSSEAVYIGYKRSTPNFYMKGQSVRGRGECLKFYGCNWDWDYRNKDAWHKIIVNYDGKVLSMSVDGTIVDARPYTGYKFNLNNKRFGLMTDLTVLDNLKIYNYPILEVDHCIDYVQNYDEEGIDCGGSCDECFENVFGNTITLKNSSIDNQGKATFTCEVDNSNGINYVNLLGNWGGGWHVVKTLFPVEKEVASLNAGATATASMTATGYDPKNVLKDNSDPTGWWSGYVGIDATENAYVPADTYWQVNFDDNYVITRLEYDWMCKNIPSQKVTCNSDLMRFEYYDGEKWVDEGLQGIQGEHERTSTIYFSFLTNKLRLIKPKLSHVDHGGTPFGIYDLYAVGQKPKQDYVFEIKNIPPGTYEWKCEAYESKHDPRKDLVYGISSTAKPVNVGWYCKSPNCDYNGEICYSESYVKPDDATKICREGEWIARCGDGFCDSSESCNSCLIDCGECIQEGEPIAYFKFEDDFEDEKDLFKLTRSFQYSCCAKTDKFVESEDGKALATDTKAFDIDCLYEDSDVCKNIIKEFTFEFDVLVNKHTTRSYIYYLSNHRTNSLGGKSSGFSVGFMNELPVRNTLFVNAYGSDILYQVPTINKWYHVKAIFNDGVMKFYLDGELIESKNYSGGGAKLADFAITTQSPTAALDNFKFYNFAKE